ncbi:MAG: DUF4114 domain-containing protein [Pseudomonadota bacterium]
MTEFRVTTTTDESDPGDGLLTLREAIDAANAADGADQITFDDALEGQTIVLTQGELTITDDLAIEGLGADVLTVDGGDSTIFDPRRVFVVDDGNDIVQRNVVIDGLTIQGGYASGGGEQTTTGARGGGIFNREALELNDSVVQDSVAQGYYIYTSEGGGIFNDGGTLVLNRSSVLDNVATWGMTYDTGQGGGIGSAGGKVIINDSIIAGNVANGDYGGSAGAGIHSVDGILEINRSTIAENRAVGRFNYFVGWFDIFGGGVFSGNTDLTINNSTIVGNEAESPTDMGVDGVIYVAQPGPQGGGVFVSGGSSSISNSTITGNKSGGVLAGNEPGTEIAVVSSLIAANLDDEDVSGGSGTFVSQGNNLIGDPGGTDGFVDGVDGDLVGSSSAPLDPGLDPAGLQDNGGPTPTIALLPGSLAVDRGSNPQAFETDQRGDGFDRENGAGAEIGAFESGTSDGPAPITVAFSSAAAGFNNLFGWYDKTSLEAHVLFVDSKRADGFTAMLPPMDPAQVGFFLVPDGGDAFAPGGAFAGEAPTALELRVVDEGGRFVVAGDLGPLLGRVQPGGDLEPVAYFTDADKNPGGAEQAREGPTGRVAWEDLPAGGDGDFDDLVIDTGQPVTLEVVDSAAGFDNLLGWYDRETGAAEIVAVDVAVAVGERFDLLVPDRSRVELFLVADGADAFDPGGVFGGVDPASLDLRVHEVGGRFVVVDSATDQALLGRTTGNGNLEPLAYFTEAFRNPDDGLEHTSRGPDGLIGWEDLFGGGDQDFDDLQVVIDVVPDPLVS